MEGEGRPAGVTALIGELRQAAAFTGGGEWLAKAMHAPWKLAASMLEFDGLAD